MELSEFRKNLIEDIKTNAAAEGEGTVLMFVRGFLENLQDINIIQDFELCYYSGKIGRKNCRVDAYSFDDFDYSMSLFIADYDGLAEIQTLTKTDATSLFERLGTFVDGSINRDLEDRIEISTPVYDLVENLVTLRSKVRKYRFFIITDKQMSTQITTFDENKINGVPVEYNVWSIERLYKVMESGAGNEPIVIDFVKQMQESGNAEKGLPYLLATNEDDIKSYLCVIPGKVLAGLYDDYGSRLLEGNVRSFLSTRGNVNKSIRKTILGFGEEDKRLFFSYNNGISATASNVKTDGRYITTITNLQIVNGGQTTASLSNTQFKDKADLSGIYVQMKLTEIPDASRAHELIPKISRYSNSQNKVSDADFFSNHEFNVRMEKISRALYAPAVNGNQYETHWFFERTRGQYEQAQSKMSKAEKTKYGLQNPKSQLITKTDFAKYRNTWEEKPYWVCLGAQKNFNKFAELLVERWEKNDKDFNEKYYRDTVAIAIMFKYIDKMVLSQDWYEKGYKANIVTYTLSLFHFLINKQYSGCEINLRYIWEKQAVPDQIKNAFIKLSKIVFDHITSSKREIDNVTEWTKKKACWDQLIDNDISLSEDVKDYVLSKDEIKSEKASGRREQAILGGIEVQTEVVKKGSDYWERAIIWGKTKKMLNEVEISFLSSATKIKYGRIPTEKQCQRIVNIEAKLLDEGFE